MAKKSNGGGNPSGDSGYVFPTHMVPAEQTGAERKNFLNKKKINSARLLVEKREGARALKKVAPAFFDAVAEALALDVVTAEKK